jgi:hypothetical protein
VTTEDPTETLLTESLDRHAADAPDDHDLLTTVHTRLRRRRTGRTIGAAVVVAVAVATTITTTHSLSHEAAPAGQPVSDIPGWRWESFRTVQVQVPPSWTNFVSGPAPCTNLSGSKAPSVGRLAQESDREKSPCAVAVFPAEERREYLWFGDVQAPGIKHYDQGWTEETRLVNGVKLSVLTKDDALRTRILDSAVPITDTDHYGCKAFDPLANSSSGRFTPSGNKDQLGTVESIDICEYSTGPLVSSSQLTGADAQALAKGLTHAPDGPPPAPVAGCENATTIYVLRVHGSTGHWQGRLKYSPCYLRGQLPFDDGATRSLVPLAIADLVRTGVHKPATMDLIDPPGPVVHPAR